ncbi:hypothetical protein [Clostridium disporicum]|uniref:hypothetical protein n=1 Tax=Clostridium disporicum TaxID=84024 RepID=UPI0034A15438
MKLKLFLVLGLMLLTGCSDKEMAKFWGNYNEWYAGLIEGVVQEVVFKYHDELIDSRKIECNYYVELNDGTQLKFNKSYHAKENSCKYQANDNVSLEVYEDSLGDKRYELIFK